MVLRIRRNIRTIINISVLRKSTAKRDRALYNPLSSRARHFIYHVETFSHHAKIDKRNNPSSFNLVSRFQNWIEKARREVNED